MRFLLIKKEAFALFCLKMGLLITFLGTLHPWFMWPLGNQYIIPAALILFVGMIISNTMDEPVFSRKTFFAAMLALFVFNIYIPLTSGANLNGFIAIGFHLLAFLAIYRVDWKYHEALSDFFARFFGSLVGVSMAAYLGAHLGVRLPSSMVDFNDGQYIFYNYFLYMEDAAHVNDLIPRFHSVFLEPGHLGSTCAFLLAIQMDKWKRWYNVLIIIALLISLSLAGYLLLFAVVLLHLWMKRRQFIVKLVAAVIAITGIGTAAFFYDQGDNPLFVMIVSRLEVDDGEMSGDNRVSTDFQNEYEAFLHSPYIFFGKDFDYTTFGNSGYKVFLFDFGLVGLVLVFLFYFFSYYSGRDKRAQIAAAVLSLLIFLNRANPLWYCDFIPLYLLSQFARPKSVKGEEDAESNVSDASSDEESAASSEPIVLSETYYTDHSSDV